MTEKEKAIREYYRLGWMVFPGNSKTRAPIMDVHRDYGQDGVKYLEKHRPPIAVIEQWFSKHPESIIKLQTGKISGVTVLDIDQGEKSGDSLEWRYTGLTMASFTRSGGKHVFCSYEPRIRNSTKRLHPQIDIKNDGGSVTLPETLNACNWTHGKYSWDPLAPFCAENLNNLARFPAMLLMKQDEERRKFKHDYGDLFHGSAEGVRHSDLVSIVGHLIQQEVAIDLVYWIAQAFGQNCSPPMDEREIDRTIRDLTTRYYDKPRTISNFFQRRSRKG